MIFAVESEAAGSEMWLARAIFQGFVFSLDKGVYYLLKLLSIRRKYKSITIKSASVGAP